MASPRAESMSPSPASASAAAAGGAAAAADNSRPLAVVTGAGSGIGRALAVQLAARDYRLALADINEVGLEETARQLRWPQGNGVESGDAHCVGNTTTAVSIDYGSSPPLPPPSLLLCSRVDVSSRDGVFEWADKVMTHFDTPPDLVVNNAGVAVSQSMADISWDDWDFCMGVNLGGVVAGTKAFLPAMLKANKGCIANVSSVFGLMGVPTQGVYNASKFAVRGFTEALQHELSARPKCNVWSMLIMPGGVKTGIARSARFHVDPEGNTDSTRAHARFDSVAHTSPESAAATILSALDSKRKRVLIGPDAYAIDWLVRCLPTRYWTVMSSLIWVGRGAEWATAAALSWWRGGVPIAGAPRTATIVPDKAVHVGKLE